jgi:3-methyl-2-oxobutanoate hydroxymethyltransferase
MSSDSKSEKRVRRMSIPEIAARKGGEPVVCMTAYYTRMAELLDPTSDLLLVGDSLGMVLYGMDSTLPVELDVMIRHGAAVVRGSSSAVVIIDMPFGSYEESPAQAFRNCARAMAETGAQGIKLEGGQRMQETIAFLVARGIPVMAHIGLTPQAMNVMGGFKTQGHEKAQQQAIIADAKAVAAAGAFATVIEGVPEPLARKITASVANVTIGIGASAACDGQVLVTEDMLGFFDRNARFVKKYADAGGMIRKAAAEYAADVRARKFPGKEHTYAAKGKS